MGEIINFDRSKLEKDLAASRIKDKFDELEPRLKKLPQYRGKVPSKTFLGKDPNVQKGQCYWIENENSLFTVVSKDKKGIQLRPLDMNATVSAGYSVYEMNQTMTAKEPLLDFTDDDKVGDIEDDLVTFIDATENDVYLMYSRDLHYFTLLHTVSPEIFGEDVLGTIRECIEHTWDIVSIDVDMSEEEGMPHVEIWIRDRKATTTENALANHMLYILPFDQQVIEI